MDEARNVFLRDLTLADEFPEVSRETWEEAVSRTLDGGGLESLISMSHEGIPVRPLYTPEDLPRSPGYPGLPPFTRGRRALGPGADGWEVCQRAVDPEPGVAAEHMAAMLRQGVHSVWLRPDLHARLGRDADSAPGDAADGLMVSRVEDLDQALAPVDLERTPVRLSAGANAVALAALLVAVARRRDVAPLKLTGSVDCDPLGALAADGALAVDLDRALALTAEVAAWATRHSPGLHTVAVSSLPYHGAGASAVQEVAFTLATGVEYLRVLTGAGLGLADACSRTRMVIGVGRDLFLEVAKLRALRRVWSAVVRSSGGGPASQVVQVHAVGSPRTLTVRDPWVNPLRSTVEAFAAVVGGADTVSVVPFDGAIGPSDDLALRLAANTQSILREESRIGQVVDPAGGSWYVERLTDDLARTSWALFQEIERRGGMAESLLGGWVAERVQRTMLGRLRAVATRRDPVTGVSTYPNLGEEAVQRAPVDVDGLRGRAAEVLVSHRKEHAVDGQLERLAAAAREPGGGGEVVDLAVEAYAAGATLGQVSAATSGGGVPPRLPPLQLRREAEPFEELRQASDRHLALNGSRPSAFLANLGPVAEHRVRASFAGHLLSSGGVEVLGNDGFATVEEATDAFVASGAQVAVICSSDQRYPEMVPVVARALKRGGAVCVVVAGRPGEHEAEWCSSGVDRYIHLGCDAIEVLDDLHNAAGVTR